MNANHWKTLEEAAAVLLCSAFTLRRAIWNGELEAYRPGKRYLISDAAIERFRQKRTRNAQASAA